MNYRLLATLTATTFFLADVCALHADVKMPAIFGDHMVLQQGMKLPVWGTADPNETVTVTVGTETGKATADAGGKWRVDLAPLHAQPDPVTMTVAGKNSLTFSDVLVGEVWVCSGQSNMEFNLSGANWGSGSEVNATATTAAANDPQLRIFRVVKKTSLDPLNDVTGNWELCTPQSIGTFSAVGYFFGRDLRQKLNRPVGLIGTYWGGTPAQAWTSLSGLQKDPELQHYVDSYQKTKANFPQALAAYPAKELAYQAAQKVWQQSPAGQALAADMEKWKSAMQAALAAGQAPPPIPRSSAPQPHPPSPPDGGSRSPTNLYNGMLAPLIPFAIKGVIWYQGEANQNWAAEYHVLFARMITDWREKWNEGDFPFLFVQLASFKAGPAQTWPFLRESQLKTLSLPNTGMATAVDIGDPGNIHPRDKEDVGNRLALAARHVAYGETLVYSGPLYAAMTTKTNEIHLTFTQEGSGLTIGKAPWAPQGVQPLPTDKLVGFTIAGEDKNFVPADARIEGNAVIVSSPQVPKPVAVRYDWANAPQGNLYNQGDLPASPFRTDDWSDPAMQAAVVTAK